MERLTGTDAAFLAMETPTMHLHVMGVLVLDPSDAPEPLTIERLAALFSERIHLIPPFRQRFVGVPGSLDHPRRVEDPDFDLRQHLHHHTLGPGAGPADLAAFVGDLAGRPLDRNRPLWEGWLVDGFADGSVALVTKIHHAIMDGGAGGEVMAALFDLEREGAVVEAAPPWSGEGLPNPLRLVAEAGLGTLRRLTALPGALVRTVEGVVGSFRASNDQGTAAVQLAPGTPFNGPLTSTRVVAFAHCRLDDLKEVRRAYGTTINDVVLAAATASLRRYLLDRDIHPDRALVASVPVALPRGDGDTAFGNHTSNMMVTLPVHLDDPVEALLAIHHDAAGAKAVQQALGPDILDDVVGLAPVPLLHAASQLYSRLGLGRLHPPVFNAVVSNVAGPPMTVYLGGAQVVATYPMGPLIGSTALNLTVFSQTGQLDVGVMACPDLVDDVDAIAEGFVAGVDALVTMARSEATLAPTI